MRPSKTQQLRDLQTTLSERVRFYEKELATARTETSLELTGRISAQRGLVVYVRALEEFNKRIEAYRHVKDGKKLFQGIERDLRELGLWNVRLAYDPDKDLSLSVASPRRRGRT